MTRKARQIVGGIAALAVLAVAQWQLGPKDSTPSQSRSHTSPAPTGKVARRPPPSIDDLAPDPPMHQAAAKPVRALPLRGAYAYLGGEVSDLEHIPVFKSSDVPATKVAMAHHMAFAVSPNTRVQIGDFDDGYVQIEVADGPSFGRLGWVPMEWLVQEPSRVP